MIYLIQILYSDWSEGEKSVRGYSVSGLQLVKPQYMNAHRTNANTMAAQFCDKQLLFIET